MQWVLSRLLDTLEDVYDGILQCDLFLKAVVIWAVVLTLLLR